MKASVATLHSIGEQLECQVNHLRDKKNGTVAEYLIREKKSEEDFAEVFMFSLALYKPCLKMFSESLPLTRYISPGFICFNVHFGGFICK